ncbi:MAG: hypothetical protein ACK6AD_03335 [Cyanobacteriota bacterium]
MRIVARDRQLEPLPCCGIQHGGSQGVPGTVLQRSSPLQRLELQASRQASLLTAF